MPIAHSELILTASQKVYHLNIGRDDLATTIITVGDPGRVAEVSKYFDDIEYTSTHREFVVHTGRLGAKRITVLSSGIGPDNIDIVLNELDAVANIDFDTREIKEQLTRLTIIRLGTCGSLQADVPVDSLVVSTHGIGLDNLMHYYQPEYTPAEVAMLDAFCEHSLPTDSKVKPYVVSSDHHLLAQFDSSFFKGITVTCPGFYAPQGRVLRAALQYPLLVDRLSSFAYENYRITNFEMESAAIFGLGRVLGHRCIAVNTVVANRIQKTFTHDGHRSVENLIQRSLELISCID